MKWIEGHESSCWGGFPAGVIPGLPISETDILGLGGAPENTAPISEILAGGTAQTHYNAPSPWNNNIHPKTTYASENVNMQVTFPPPPASSTSSIMPPTITIGTYPQPESYTVQHNFEYATSALRAPPLTPAGDTLMAEYDLSLLTIPYLEYQAGDPPVSSTSQIQASPAGNFGFGLTQGSQPTLYPELDSVTAQYCNTLPGWLDEELGGFFSNFGAWEGTMSEGFTMLENGDQI